MLYPTPEFILLFTVTFVLFLFFNRYRARFLILITASLLFYAWVGVFDFLIYLLVVTISWAAVFLARKYPAQKGRLLALGILLMVGHLFFWKYASWLVGQIQIVFPAFFGGMTLKLRLPIGISFFTLQGIAYLVDYSRDDAEYMKLSMYLLFKSFFAQLVAGPIVRARQLLPQLQRLEKPQATDISLGLALFMLGVLKKLVIADRMAPFVDAAFLAPHQYDRWTLVQALLGYTVQIWADFSGYTDMGRGAARMLGIHLPENFLSPYFARTPSDFWRRWHITLSEWVRDYIYTPLVLRGNKSASQAFAAIVLSMGICGLWHGAQWHFVVWGLYHGFLLIMERKIDIHLPGRLQFFIQPLATFSLIAFGWLIFRANDFYSLSAYIKGIALNAGMAPPPAHGWPVYGGILFCAVTQTVFYYDLRRSRFALAPAINEFCQKQNIFIPNIMDRPVTGFCLGATLAIIFVGAIFLRQTNMKAFIYFQF